MSHRKPKTAKKHFRVEFGAISCVNSCCPSKASRSE